MEARVMEFKRGWKQMLWDSCSDGKIFYGIPAGI